MIANYLTERYVHHGGELDPFVYGTERSQAEATMANIQRQFEKFDEEIRLGRFDENEILRDKRDIIQDKLKARLPEVFEQHGEECPNFSFRDQGSYEMGTGTKPLEGDYDIDQGLYFDVSTDTYPDPVVLKKRVHEALVDHTDDVRIRRSCVTAFYHRDHEAIYHVDIAVYSSGPQNIDGKSRLAKGREHSADEYRIWEVSNPQALSDTILGAFKGTDRAQFRRVVRYLKRWRDENFSKAGHAAPLGIGLTVATYQQFQAVYSDPLTGKADDLTALRGVVSRILSQFRSIWDTAEQQFVRRLIVNLPVEPWGDLFEQMTNLQIADFEQKLQKLLSALDAAIEAVAPEEACQALQKVLGSDFPVPEQQETAKSHPRAITSSSSAA